MSILVGYVPRPEGERALEWAAAEARLRAVPLHVVYVEKIGPGQGEADDILEHRTRLQRFQADLTAEGLECEARVVYSTHRTSDALLEEIDGAGAELLVLGLRGRSAVGKLLMGSVAQELLLGAPCPVVGVKATDPRR